MATINSQERAAWLEERRGGLGGSDIAKIVGASKWGSAVDVWLDKKGMKEPQPENMAMKLGTALEPFVADQFVEMSGKRIIEYVPTIHGTGDYSFALGNLDRIVVEDGQDINAMVGQLSVGDLSCVESILECKTSSDPEAWVDEETGEPRVPVYYAFQVMHYMGLIPSCKRVYVCVVFLGRHKDRELFIIERDDAKIRRLYEIERAWWQKHIIEGEMPEVNTLKDVTELYPASDPAKIYSLKDIMSGENEAEKADAAKLEANCAELVKLQAEIKEREEAADGIKDFIAAKMKDCETLVGTDGETILATFRTGKPTVKDIVDYEAVVREAGVSPEVIAAHTTKGVVTRKATRPLLVKKPKAEKPEGAKKRGKTAAK